MSKQAVTKVRVETNEFNNEHIDVSNLPDLVLEREEILSSLSHMQSVVERKTTIPILANVKLESKSGRVTLTCTDMELALSEEINAIVNKPIVLTVPVHMFYEIVKKMPAHSKIELLIDKKQQNSLIVRSGSASFLLSFLEADNFPIIEFGKSDLHFTLDSSLLSELINKTRFAACTDVNRYALNGVYFHVVDGELVCVATDGHRLAKVAIKAPQTSVPIPGVIIPRKTCAEISKLLLNTKGDVSIAISRTKIVFAFGDVILISKIIEGNYPGYQNVIPKQFKNIMEANVEELKEAVDRVSIVCPETTRAICFSLKKIADLPANSPFKDISDFSGILELDATNENRGKGIETVLVNYDGDAGKVNFNSRYIMEVLSLIEGPKVHFSFSLDDGLSTVFDPDNAKALFVVMPMIMEE